MPELLALAEEIGRRDFIVTGEHLMVGLVASLLMALCVAFHYEGMSLLSARLPRLAFKRRARIVVLILGMLVVHVIEVWIFAAAYYVLDAWPELGRLAGEFHEGALDFVYFSVVTYSSLGYGDLVPMGPLRILAGCETLLGLSLLTWTASFAFLEMQRDWQEFRRQGPPPSVLEEERHRDERDDDEADDDASDDDAAGDDDASGPERGGAG